MPAYILNIADVSQKGCTVGALLGELKLQNIITEEETLFAKFKNQNLN